MPPLIEATSPLRQGRPAEPLPNGSTRSSLESLAELEALLEEQHNSLIARGFIAPTEEAPWAVGRAISVE